MTDSEMRAKLAKQILAVIVQESGDPPARAWHRRAARRIADSFVDGLLIAKGELA